MVGNYWQAYVSTFKDASIMPMANRGYTGDVVRFLMEAMKGYTDGAKARGIQPQRFLEAMRDPSYDVAYTWQRGELPEECRDCTFRERCYKPGTDMVEKKGSVFILELSHPF